MIGKLVHYFLILVPFIYFDKVLDASGTPRLLFLSVFLMLAYLLCFIKNIQITYPKHFTSVYFIYIGALLVSSYTRNYIDYVELIKRIEYILFFILIFNIDKKSSDRYLITGSVYFVGIILLFGFIQLLWISSLNLTTSNLYAISTSFSHKNIYASVLVLSLPLLALWKSSKHLKYLLVTLVIVMLLILQTRSALLALFCSTLYYSYNKSGLIKKNAPKIIGSALGISVLSFFFLQQLGTFDDFLNILDFGDSSSIRSSTITERLFLWKRSFQMFFEYWLTGVGLGNWPIYFASYGLTLWRLRQGDVLMQRPHNDVLENFNELGLIGGLLFLIILSYPLLKKSSYKDSLTVNFGLISFILISLFSFPQERIVPSLLFLILISLKLKSSTVCKIKAPVLLLVSGLLISLSSIVYQRLKSEILFKDYITQRNNLTIDESRNLLLRAQNTTYQMDKTSTPIDWYIGELYLKSNNLKSAKTHLNKALLLNPYHIHILNSLGGCSLYENDFLGALKYFEQAIEIAPYFQDGLYNLALCLAKTTSTDKAILTLERIENKESTQFLTRIKSYAKQEISNQILIAQDSTKTALLKNLFLNEEWILEIVIKSYENKINFTTQLKLDLDYLLKS